MMRLTLLAACVAIAAFAGWRILALMQADAAMDRGDVATALRWRPHHSRALLVQGEQRLAAGDLNGATASATHLLQDTPIDGHGYRLLAQVADARHQPQRALALYRIAARRAPRDLASRAWLAQYALEQGDYPQALTEINQVLVMSPRAGKSIFPVLVKLAADPVFMDALAGKLRSRPPWRASMLDALRAPTGDPALHDRLLAALQRKGGLDEVETAAWLESLMRQGRWGEAYARWAGPLVARGEPVPVLFNGDFSHDPDGAGFNWRRTSVPGSILGFEPAAGQSGRMLHLRFLGRRVSGVLIAHPLLLAPGPYRLSWREQATGLRGDPGIEWRLSCDGEPSVIGRSEPMSGAYPMRTRALDFTVLPQGCQGQWLHLAPAGVAGGGQVLSGELWVGQLVLQRSKKAEIQ